MRHYLFAMMAALALSVCCGTSAFATTVLGDLNPGTVTNGAALDGYTGGVYADAAQTFGTTGFANSVTFNGSSSGNNLTFMVGTYSGNQFTPTGIFNPITTTGGLETYNLNTVGLASGSDYVTANETFGWTDQKIGTSFNGGSIYYVNGAGSYDFFQADQHQNEAVTIGTAVGSLGFGPRDYSVNFTVVPEPSSVILGVVGVQGFLLSCGGAGVPSDRLKRAHSLLARGGTIC